ncbi:MAG TPA: PKD domain-containing protein, partial [Bacteroidales bacterium]|nr:PKD domain-containing protein [Bacteroidales bacterium]
PNASSLQAGFVGIPVLGTSPLTVNFVDVSTGNPDQWQWNFGNGMTWTGKYPPPVTYTNLTSDPLNYSASLTIADANGQPSQCFRVDYVTVLPQSMGNGGANASFSFDQLNLAVPSYVCFTNTSSGDISGVYWDFDDGSSSTAHSPVHIFNAPGFYDVVLTITDLAGQAYQQEQTVYVYPPFNSALAVDFGVRGPAVAGDFTRFDDLCSGGPSFARKLWDFGDGTLAEVLGVPLHLYYSPGVYQVRLEVRDYLDNLLGVAMKNVTVIPDALNDLTADLNQLVPTDPALNDMFGLAVATDREWAFIGAPHDDDQGSASGSVYVYKLNPDSTWTFFQKIALSNGSKDDYFGHALDFDGQRLIAGAPGNSSSSHGKAAIFQFNGSSWVETLLISCPSTKNYYFGWAVSIDHGILCIGAPSHTQALPGAAWVYKENGGSWALETKLEDASASLPDRFGYAVDIQGDHAITTLYHPTATDEIWFWKKTAGVWQTVSKRFQDNASGVSLDCPLAVCGDTWNNRVVLYAFDGSQWHVDGFVVPADGNSGNTNFGQSAALRGRYLLAGKPGDGTLAPSGGSMYLFRRNDTGDWIQWKKFTPSSPEAYEYYGWSVSLSSSHALAGAFGWKGNRGSAYMVNDVIPPCERVRDWCHLDLYTGQHLADDCGELRLGGDGCMVNLWPGSGGLWYSRNIDLLPGLTLYAGSEATFIPVDCSLFSPGLKMGCPCPPGSQGNTDVHRSTAEVTLYPNPTFGTFTLSWPEGMGRAQVSLMGQDGRKIKDLGESGTGQTYNLPAIGNGVYLLTLRFADTIRAIRLIKI